MDKIWKIILSGALLVGVFKYLPKEEKKTKGLRIAAAKDSSWELLQKIGERMRFEKIELSETLMGDC